MEKLKQRILDEGKAQGNNVLLVDSFINHQIDVDLMKEIGAEFARMFADSGITRVATIESSGIAPAIMTADALRVPLIVMKKSGTDLLSEELLQTPVFSYTKGANYQLTLKKKYIDPDDCVLIIDDFLANGEAAASAAKLIEAAGAKVGGIGVVIEKAFQNGRKRLRELGHTVVSLAPISYMNAGAIEFEEPV